MHRIAIVEDDMIMQGVLKAMLEHAGFEVVIFQDGAEALAAIPAVRPDFIILDVNLPDMTGHDICRRLKQHPVLRDVPTIMLTGEARDLQQRVSGLEAGADDYLFKPIGPKVLLARIKALLKAGTRRS